MRSGCKGPSRAAREDGPAPSLDAQTRRRADREPPQACLPTSSCPGPSQPSVLSSPKPLDLPTSSGLTPPTPAALEGQNASICLLRIRGSTVQRRPRLHAAMMPPHWLTWVSEGRRFALEPLVFSRVSATDTQGRVVPAFPSALTGFWNARIDVLLPCRRGIFARWALSHSPAPKGPAPRRTREQNREQPRPHVQPPLPSATNFRGFSHTGKPPHFLT